MKRIKIYDCNEMVTMGVGYADTWEEVLKFARQYDMDTNGENYLCIAPLNVDTGEYMWTKCGEPLKYWERPAWIAK